MKLELKFTSEEFEDKNELADLLKCNDYKFALMDIDNWLRDEIKYRNKVEYQEVRDVLTGIMNVRGIEL